MQPFRLPPQLAERQQALTHAAPRRGGRYVLYWAHHALRAHENPALETAAVVARQLGLPLLVYQGLGGRHRYNSDRHHRFILEAARDFAAELNSHGLRLLFHLPTDPLAAGPLPDLLRRAAVAVSELYPVPPFRQWCARHAAREPELPFLLTDSSCNLPMTAGAGFETRAFRFRKAHMADLRQRIATDWPEPASWPPAFDDDPGFTPFDLDDSLEDAIGACRIDHAVPPVADTPGGSTAGYRRWQAFLEEGLDAYHRLRDDAALPAAVSRLSPYLHYGCVSPFRIAREAAARGSEGAEKFLDELLTWRELSHHFCFRSPTLESLHALPGWARASLEEHRVDPRANLLDWELLARGRSGEPLWDLAQNSLLRHGELHNNLRMSWGKAFLPWAAHPARALKLMIDLNHRYALDGSDPNSYGGLLWCLGQFDRAFPPGPVFGKVRQRSLRRHAERLDLTRYARRVSRPANGRRLRVAVVGAGLSGLTAARILEDQGHEVVVVDKGRGPGGRMSTRREADWAFDHGAQYFTARDPRFLRHVRAWQERGLVEPWPARIGAVGNGKIRGAGEDGERFVPVPAMRALCGEMASELAELRLGWQLVQARPQARGWQLQSATGDCLEAEALVSTVPPPQITPMLGDGAAGKLVRASLGDIGMEPCWAVLAVLDRPLLPDWDAAFVNEGPLSWVCGQASKPGRPDAEAWVLHAEAGWSEAHLEHEPAYVCERLLAAAAALPRAAAITVRHARAHRWRYARARQALDTGCLWFPEQRLAVAGDWCHGSRVEGAFLSGAAAAGRILGSRWARGLQTG